MVKITVEGQEATCIVTHPVVPQPIELIEQRNGQRVTVETCRALEFGDVNPASDGEAAELLRWLWEHAGNTGATSGQWNGWQAAAWIATNDLAVAARLAGAIEFRVRDGGRRALPARTVEACLQWEIATRHCRCGAGSDGPCTCLDDAFAVLNVAIDGGARIENRRKSRDLVDCDNARLRLFASRAVRDRSEFVIVVKATRSFRDGSHLIDEGTLLELVNATNITSGRRLDKEQRKRWPDHAWSRPAIYAWWREKFNPTGKTGRKKSAAKRGDK